MTRVFISWDNFNRRTDLLAGHLGAKIHTASYGTSGRVASAPWRYSVQTWRTWRALNHLRPDVILIHNPPIVAVVVVYLAARWSGARLVIDSHTAAFESQRWRWSLGLHRYLSRRATATIVHNSAQAAIVASWGCPFCIIGFIPGDYSQSNDYALSDGFHIAVISTYKNDEPITLIFEAARHLPEVTFHFTGRAERLPALQRDQRPPNCHLTGFLSYPDYVGLLRNASAILDLTTRDNTVLLGGFEAVSIGTPLITSDWPVLKACFSEGTVHVTNTVEGICRGVRTAQEQHPLLCEGIRRLHDRLTAEWQTNRDALEVLLAQ